MVAIYGILQVTPSLIMHVLPESSETWTNLSHHDSAQCILHMCKYCTQALGYKGTVQLQCFKSS